jgi:hypothetical protein
MFATKKDLNEDAAEICGSSSNYDDKKNQVVECSEVKKFKEESTGNMSEISLQYMSKIIPEVNSIPLPPIEKCFPHEYLIDDCSIKEDMNYNHVFGLFEKPSSFMSYEDCIERDIPQLPESIASLFRE